MRLMGILKFLLFFGLMPPVVVNKQNVVSKVVLGVTGLNYYRNFCLFNSSDAKIIII